MPRLDKSSGERCGTKNNAPCARAEEVQIDCRSFVCQIRSRDLIPDLQQGRDYQQACYKSICGPSRYLYNSKNIRYIPVSSDSISSVEGENRRKFCKDKATGSASAHRWLFSPIRTRRQVSLIYCVVECFPFRDSPRTCVALLRSFSPA